MNKLCDCGCGKEVKNQSVKTLSGHHNRLPEIKEKKRLASQLKYGKDNPMQSEIIQKKVKHTNIEKYDTEYVFQLKTVKDKIKKTHLEKRGVEHPSQSEEIKQQKIQTNRKHRGVDNPMQSKIVQELARQTTIDHWGVPFPMQSEIIKEKAKQTSIENWNVPHPTQSEIVKEKTKQTSIDHWGVPFTMQSELVQEKSRQKNIERWGFDNYAKTFEFRQFARERMISFITSGLKNGNTFSPMKGFGERPFISDLQHYTSYFIDNNAKIIGYFPDGYIKELNIVIEFDEPWHNRTCFKKHDLQKNNDYQKIGLKIFRVSEREWSENKEHVINQFKELLNAQMCYR